MSNTITTTMHLKEECLHSWYYTRVPGESGPTSIYVPKNNLHVSPPETIIITVSSQ